MKTFKQFLDDRGERPYQFSKRTGIKPTTAWNAYKGKPMSGKQALAIYNACGCNVSLKGLIDPDLAALVREST